MSNKCNNCVKKFNQKYEMNRQLQKVHSDEDDYSNRNFMDDNFEGIFENQIL